MNRFNQVISDEASTIEKHLETRDTLNDYLMNLIGSKYINGAPDEWNNHNVVLPPSISKESRYTLHRYTTRGFFPASSDKPNGDRVMTLRIDKEYVSNIMKNYVFLPQQAVAPVQVVATQRSERQIIFDNLIEFINNNFQAEMAAYIKNI